MSCAWVISHMMTMSPNLISLFPSHRALFYDLRGFVLLFRCLSLGYLLCRRVTFVTCRDWESCWLFFYSQKFLFWLESTMYCLCIMMRLFTINGCGDYRQVWCVAFFPKTSILVVSFGLHQWNELVDRISMYFAQLAFCSVCREVARQRFLSMLSHSSP